MPNHGAIMSGKPPKLIRIDDLSRHVENVMGRATTPLPKSLIAQTGGMLRYCLRKHLEGNLAHPGMTRIAKMGKCSERQAQRNMRVLESWGVFSVAAYGKGGRWAPRYRVEIDGLRQSLLALGCNPSSEIIEKMELVRGDICPVMRGDKWRDMRRDTMSPGIQYNNQTTKPTVH